MQSNEIRIPKNPDFDLSPNAQPCQYFKSSFARSLSLNGTKSLEIDLNFGLTPFNISAEEEEEMTVINNNNKNIKNEVSPRSLATLSCGSMGAIKAARSLLFTSTNTDKQGNDKINNKKDGDKPADDSKINSVKCVWEKNQESQESQMTPPTPIQQQPHQSEPFSTVTPNNSQIHNQNTDLEIIRLRKECQSLIEENRRLIGLASNSETENRQFVMNGNGMTSSTGKNGSGVVETVFLQTQIDTLNWQLKQVESSRQMYRAVTDEVARFLDKCYRSLEVIHKQQQQCQPTTTIGRSKSVVQVFKNHDSDSSCHSTSITKTKSTSRARSSTNLIDAKYFCNTSNETPPSDVTCDSYEHFRDFTWRRTPKVKQSNLNLETNPEKLSNEAYRLLRTVQNLMNTQEPSLLNPTSNAIPPPLEPLPKNDEAFTRKSQSRESRLSIRSSTDDSVHSNATTTTTNSSSSLKTETDEEHSHRDGASPSILNIPSSVSHQNTNNNHHQTHLDRVKDNILLSIDDESGFSSMNSFQEIGLPLVNSTMRSIAGNSSMSSSASSASSSESTTEMENTAIENNNMKNSTLIAANQQEKLGLPRVVHRRWDSAPVTPGRLQLSNKTEDSLRVLWV